MPNLLIMYSNDPPSARHVERLRCLGCGVSVATSETEAIAAAPEADAILGHRYLRQALPHTQRLRWVQSTAAGVDHLLSADLLRLSPVLTRCPIFSRQVAWHAISLALAVLRRVPELSGQQRQAVWRRPDRLSPVPSTALVLGLGTIGSEVARLLGGLGIAVTGLARRSSPEKRALCARLIGPAEWRACLPDTDLLVCCLCRTRHTLGLVDAAAVAALPRHAIVVDVARHGIVDYEAVRTALVAGQLAGAATDVLQPLPIDPNDPLLNAPNLLITPKLAVFHDGRQDELEAFIEVQVKRYLANEPLYHPIELQRLAEEAIVP